MGYVCPVCEDPQVDGKHLADHLAVTALLGDDDHEHWLDEHAPGWTAEDDAGLAERVLTEAETIDLPTDAGGHDHDSDGERFADSSHDPGVTFEGMESGATAPASPPLDEEAQAALWEAYELTRARRRDGDAAESEAGDASETE